MGRGKSKAKHAKVARQLKYSAAPVTNLEALEAELKGEQLGDSELDDEILEEELDDDLEDEDLDDDLEDEDLFEDDDLEDED